MTSTTTPRYRLHLESVRRQSASFHLDAAAWALAATRHAALAARVEPSFGWDGESLAQALEHADCLLASRFPKPLVNTAPRLRWIHTTGAGVDQLLPLEALREDLLLTNSSGIHSDKAGEYVQMGLLMLNAHVPEMIGLQRRHVWQARLSSSISGKTVLVIGFGDLGVAAARAALGLGLKVIALSRSGRANPALPVDTVVPVEQLDAMLPQADFVVVTAPLTAATHNLLSAARLARMRPGAGLINISRSALIDYAALAERLDSGACSGALLDVFDPEPLPAHAPYWDTPNLLVTPHVSCDVPDYNQRVLDLWFGNFERFLRGVPLHNLINRTLGY